MFTTEQIKAAHSKVRSGADFPAYIREIKTLGVNGYVAWVTDGHVDYYGNHDHTTTAPAHYHPINVAETVDIEQFSAGLKAHQAGQLTTLPS